MAKKEKKKQKQKKTKQNKTKKITGDPFHNILGRFDVLPNFPVTASKAISDYHL